MTASVTYRVEEGPINKPPYSYQIQLFDSENNPCRTMQGPSRQRCIEALRESGFTINE